ncbi:transposase [Myxococcus sp. XM-1-1-1]|uniref:IS66 family transposase n=1 Tax=Myxococcus sp. XM-1-1-1 TaxID=2874602 RepID=UPI001CBDE6C4
MECWAHVCRKFFDALSTAPESKTALDFILALCRVEHTTQDSWTRGTPEHLRARRTASSTVLDGWFVDLCWANRCLGCA